MKRTTVVLLCVLVVALSAGGAWYGTRLASELRDENDRLREGQEEMSKLQLALADELKRLRVERLRKSHRGATEPGPERAPVSVGTGGIGDLRERVEILERGPAANNPSRADVIGRYRRLRADGVSGQPVVEALEAVAELAKWGDRDATDIVVEALSDPDVDLRKTAYCLIGDIGNADHLAYLEQGVSDPSASVRATVAESLGSMPADLAGPLLVSLLEDKETEVVADAVEALVAIDYTAGRTGLQKLLEHSHPGIVAESAVALTAMGDQEAAARAMKHLLPGLGSPDAKKRRETIKAVRDLGKTSVGDQVLEVLEQAIEDPDAQVRAAAQKGLRQLGRSH